ncbi:cytochrome b/b6 domain-containing protein [Phaeovulum vinaykumarii]|uniref:Cytochrome b n=1 Tax=Phaeovulum vinaykumarii TaxID=407234 RepID=A0A1N7K2C6_9RHOB|nr:cytochrome b/b6 domain-containing protein [Phaeovulum vinaykumarii]SIS55733.1 Cytochrome b [Phaeovulum vinaykumarii]SOB92523.1 cytochrome b [Phaeovulum vinaykumarii]
MSVTDTKAAADAAADPSLELETVKLWDPLLRIFHWALAACVLGAWGLGHFGPSEMNLHFLLGYITLGLLAFRLVWGFVGPEHARFSSFLYGPGAFLRYALHMFSRKPSYWRGHNPMGGTFVFVLLAVLTVQIICGMLADPEDYLNVGPLAKYVSMETSRAALGLHDLLGNILAGLIVLHVAVVVFYRRWKNEDLIRPMLTGRKTVRKG